MKIISVLILLMTFFLIACSTSRLANQKVERPLSRTLQTHGGKNYDTAKIAFDFREKSYTIQNNRGQFIYTAQYEKDGQVYSDKLTNDGFTRTIDGISQNLAAKDALKYGNSLNSVVYFAQLPYKLNDPAVNQINRGKVSIKGQSYQVVEVNFNEEGGGTDHDDTFYYWINQQTDQIDFLAYRFHVDKGGVRFRAAYNPRRVNGMLFQDYVNYKVPVGTALSKLPALYEAGKLQELSRIETERVIEL